MRGERWLLRLGEYLVARACRRLPAGMRDERYQEWAAELPAILRDPDISLAWRRAARMLRYAAGTIQGAAPAPGTVTGRLLATFSLACVIYLSWMIVQTPGDWLNYVLLAWLLLTLIAPRILVNAYLARRKRKRRARR